MLTRLRHLDYHYQTFLKVDKTLWKATQALSIINFEVVYTQNLTTNGDIQVIFHFKKW
jgi:hypothetical protein